MRSKIAKKWLILAMLGLPVEMDRKQNAAPKERFWNAAFATVDSARLACEAIGRLLRQQSAERHRLK